MKKNTEGKSSWKETVVFASVGAHSWVCVLV
jgi:hypothetical protein